MRRGWVLATSVAAVLAVAGASVADRLNINIGIEENGDVDITVEVPTECPKNDPKDTKVHIPHETDCTKFYRCERGTRIILECHVSDVNNTKMHYDRIQQVCDWPERAGCIVGDNTTTKAITTEITTPRLPTALPVRSTTKIVSHKPTAENRTTVTIESTTRGNGVPTECPKVDPMGTTVHLAHETDCTKFYICDHGKRILSECPLMDAEGNRLHFNPILQVCDWPNHAGCISTGTTTTEGTVYSTTTKKTTRLTDKPTTVTPSTESITEITNTRWPTERPTESTTSKPWTKEPATSITDSTTVDPITNRPTELTSSELSSEIPTEPIEEPVSNEPSTTNPVKVTMQPTSSARSTEQSTESATDKTTSESPSEIPTVSTKISTSINPSTEYTMNPTTTKPRTEKPSDSNTDTTPLNWSSETSTESTDKPTSSELPTQRPTNPTTVKSLTDRPTDSHTDTTPLELSSEVPTEPTVIPTSSETSTENLTNPAITEHWTEKATQSNTDTTMSKSSAETSTESTDESTFRESPTQHPMNPTTVKLSTDRPTDSHTDTTPLKSSSEIPTEPTEIPTSSETSTENLTSSKTTERWTEGPLESNTSTTTSKSSSETSTEYTDVPTSGEPPTQLPTNPTTVKPSTDRPADSHTDATPLESSSEISTEPIEIPTFSGTSTENHTDPITTERWTDKPTKSTTDGTTSISYETFTKSSDAPISGEPPTQSPTNPTTVKPSTDKPTDSHTDTTMLQLSSEIPTEPTEIPTSSETASENLISPKTTERWTITDTPTLKSSSETPTETPDIPTSREPPTEYPTNSTSTKHRTDNPTESTPIKATSQFPSETATEPTNIPTSRKPSSEYPGSVTTESTISERTETTVHTTSKWSTESTEDPTHHVPSTEYSKKITTISTAWTQQPAETTINLTTPRWSTEFSSIGEVSSGTILTSTVPTADVDQNSTPTPLEIYVPHENDCSRFYKIVNNEKHLKECPRGLHFSPTEKHCDWPDKAGCELTTVAFSETTINPELEGSCGNISNNWVVAHECACNKYYTCSNGELILKECPEGLHFGRMYFGCVKPELAGCKATTIGIVTDVDTTTKVIPTDCPPDNSGQPVRLPHETNCSLFYECDNGEKILHQCQNDFHFNAQLQMCEWSDSAGCVTHATDINSIEGATKPAKLEDGTSTSLPTECPRENSGTTVQLPHPYNCSLFYTCDNGNKVVQFCPYGLEYNPRKQICDWPEAAGCVISITKEPWTTWVWSTTSGTPQDRSTESAKTSEGLKNPSSSTIEKLTTPPRAATEKLPTTPSSPTKKWTTLPSYTTDKWIRTTKPEGSTSVSMPTECPPDNSGYAVQLPHPYNCSLFYKCSEGNKVVQSCPDGLEFNAREQICDWPITAGCVASPTKEPWTTRIWSTTSGVPQDRSTETAKTSEDLKNTSSSSIEKLTTPSEGATEKLPTTPSSPTKKWTTLPRHTTDKWIRTTKSEGGTSVSLPNECPPDNSGYAVQLPHPYNCSLFYKCDEGNKVVQSCPDGLEFNAREQICDWPITAGCVASPTTEPWTTRIWSTTSGVPQDRSTETAQTSEDLKNTSSSTIEKLTTPSGGATEKLPTTPSSPTKKWTTLPSYTTDKWIRTTKPEGGTSVSLSHECPPDNSGYAVQLPHPYNCSLFYKCDEGNKVVQSCPDGLEFNPRQQICDWPITAGCVASPTKEPWTTRIWSTTSGVPQDRSTETAQTSEDLKNTSSSTIEKLTTPSGGATEKLPTTPSSPTKKWTTLPSYTTDKWIRTTKPEGGTSVSLPHECPPDNSGYAVQLPHPYNCSLFYKCDEGNKVVQSCPDGLEFNPRQQICDWPITAGCVASPTKEPWTTRIWSTTSGVPQDRSTETAITSEDLKNTSSSSIEKLTTPPRVATEKLSITPSSPTKKWTTLPSYTTNKWIRTTKPGGGTSVSMPTECPPDNSGYAVQLPHPYDCSLFYKCDEGNKVVQSCPGGLEFNAREQICDWPITAGCVASPTKQSWTTRIWSTTSGLPQDRSTETAKTSEDLKNTSSSTIEKLTTPSGGATEKLPTTLSSPTKKWTTLPPHTTDKWIRTTKPEGGTSVSLPHECPPDNSGYAVQLPHPYNCSLFYKCDEGNKVVQSCPDGLEFNPRQQICDWPITAGCITSSTTKPWTTKIWSATSGTPQDHSTETAKTSEDLKNPSSSTIEKLTTPPRVTSEKLTVYSSTTTERLTSPPSSSTEKWTTPPRYTTEKWIKTTKPEPGTSVSVPSECPPDNSGYAVQLPHPYNCSLFYKCDEGNKLVQSCPDGLEFNAREQICDWPITAGCVASPTKEPLSTRVWSTTSGTLQDRSTETAKTSADLKNPSSSTIEKSTTPSRVTKEKLTAPSSTSTETLTILPSLNTEKWTTSASVMTEEFTVPPSSTTKKLVTPLNSTTEKLTTLPSSTTETSTMKLSSTLEELVTRPSSTTEKRITLPNSITEKWITTDIVIIVPVCVSGSKLSHETDCSLYYECEEGIKELKECPPGLHFNPLLNICDWPVNAGCEKTTIQSTHSPTEHPNRPTSTTTVQPSPSEPITTEQPSLPTSTTTEQPNTPKPVMTEQPSPSTITSTEQPSPPMTTTTEQPITPNPATAEQPSPPTTTTTEQPSPPTTTTTEQPSPPTNRTTEQPSPTTTLRTEQPSTPSRVTTEQPSPLTTPTTEQPTPPTTTTTEQPSPPTTTTSEQPSTPNPVTPEQSSPPPPSTTEQPSPLTTTTEQPSPPKPTTTEEPTIDYEVTLPDTCIGTCPTEDPVNAILLPNVDCKKFCMCSNGGGYVYDCPANLHFSPSKRVCDYPRRAKCEGIGGSGPAKA